MVESVYLVSRFAGTISVGEVAEWFNAPVLKTGEPQGSGGSNPSLSAIRRVRSSSLSRQPKCLAVRAKMFGGGDM